MNRRIAMAGAWTVTAAVILFAGCMLTSFDLGSYFVCMLLPIGYILMAAGFCQECGETRRAAAVAGLVFAGVYAALIFLVYFAQVTTVRLEALEGQAAKILDFSRGGLLFSYDLLGYGMMALSTFFLGLTIEPRSRGDKWLKRLMLAHGAFFFPCFLLPMTGIFGSMAGGEDSLGGVIALELWCAYFAPIGVLAGAHFRRGG